MTQKQDHSLFREHALQHYMTKSRHDLLPQIISPPAFLIVWILMGLALMSGLFAWMERVPVFTSGSGVVKISGQNISAHGNSVSVVVFIPTSMRMQVHVGMQARAQFDTSSQYYNGTISAINPLVLSPVAIRKQYQLTCTTVPNGMVDSITATVLVSVSSSMAVENGALSQVQIQTGSQRVLDLLPFFHQLTGDA